MNSHLPTRPFHFKDAFAAGSDRRFFQERPSPILANPDMSNSFLDIKVPNCENDRKVEEMVSLMDELWQTKSILEQKVSMVQKENEVLKGAQELEATKALQMQQRLESCRTVMADEIQTVKARFDKRTQTVEQEKERLESELIAEKLKVQGLQRQILEQSNTAPMSVRKSTFDEVQRRKPRQRRPAEFGWCNRKKLRMILDVWWVGSVRTSRNQYVLAQCHKKKICRLKSVAISSWSKFSLRQASIRHQHGIRGLQIQLNSVTELKNAHETRVNALADLQAQTEICLLEAKASKDDTELKLLKLQREHPKLQDSIIPADLEERSVKVLQYQEMKKGFELALFASDKMNENLRKENSLLRQAVEILKGQLHQSFPQHPSPTRGSKSPSFGYDISKAMLAIQASLDAINAEEASLENSFGKYALNFGQNRHSKRVTADGNADVSEWKLLKAYRWYVRKTWIRSWIQWKKSAYQERRQATIIKRCLRRMMGDLMSKVFDVWKEAWWCSRAGREVARLSQSVAHYEQKLKRMELELLEGNKIKETLQMQLSMALDSMQQMQVTYSQHSSLINTLERERLKSDHFNEFVRQSVDGSIVTEKIIYRMAKAMTVLELSLEDIRIRTQQDASRAKLAFLESVHQDLSLTVVEMENAKVHLERKALESLHTYMLFHSWRHWFKTCLLQSWRLWKVYTTRKRKRNKILDRTMQSSQLRLQVWILHGLAFFCKGQRAFRELEKKSELLEQQLVTIAALKDSHEARIAAMLDLQKEMEGSTTKIDDFSSRLEFKLSELARENESIKRELNAERESTLSLLERLETSHASVQEILGMKNTLNQRLSESENGQARLKVELETLKLSKAIRWWKKSKMLRPWRRWAQFAMECCTHRSLQRKCVGRLTQGSCARAFESWEKQYREAKRQLESRGIITMAEHIHAEAARIGLTKQSSPSEHEIFQKKARHATRRMSVAMGVWTHSTVRGPWIGWKNICFERRRQQHLISMGLRKFLGGIKVLCLDFWVEATHQAKRAAQAKMAALPIEEQLLAKSSLANEQETKIQILSKEVSQVKILMQKLEAAEIAKAEKEKVNCAAMLAIQRTQDDLDEALQRLQAAQIGKEEAEAQVAVLQQQGAATLSLKAAAEDVLNASTRFEAKLTATEAQRAAAQAEAAQLGKRVAELEVSLKAANDICRTSIEALESARASMEALRSDKAALEERTAAAERSCVAAAMEMQAMLRKKRFALALSE